MLQLHVIQLKRLLLLPFHGAYMDGGCAGLRCIKRLKKGGTRVRDPGLLAASNHSLPFAASSGRYTKGVLSVGPLTPIFSEAVRKRLANHLANSPPRALTGRTTRRLTRGGSGRLCSARSLRITSASASVVRW